MGSPAIRLCIVACACLVSAGEEEIKTIDTALKLNEDLKIDSLPLVTFVDPQRQIPSNPDSHVPDEKLKVQNPQEPKLPNLPDQNLPEPDHPRENAPQENLPGEGPSDKKLSVKIHTDQDISKQNLSDGKSQGDAASVPELVSHYNSESGEVKSLQSPSANSKLPSRTTPSCPTTANNISNFRTTAKHLEKFVQFALRNTDATYFEKVRGVVAKTRELLQEKRNIDHNETLSGLYWKLPHQLRLAIAITDSYADAFLEKSLQGQDRTALDRQREQYDKKRRNEREVLKALVVESGSEGGQLVASYRALRDISSLARNNPTFVNVFRRTLSLVYGTWQKDELETDGYLNGTEEVDDLPTESAAAETSRSGQESVPAEEQDSLKSSVVGLHRRRTRNADAVPPALEESYSAFQSLVDRLPDVLKKKMDVTDGIEREILNLCAASKNVGNKEIEVYQMARKEERELLKRVLREADTYAPRILKIYELVRRGEPWNYVKLNGTYEPFFRKPSEALSAYEAIKKDEAASLSAFLAGQNPTTELRWDVDVEEDEDEDETNILARAEGKRLAEVEAGEKREDMEQQERAGVEKREDIERRERAGVEKREDMERQELGAGVKKREDMEQRERAGVEKREDMERRELRAGVENREDMERRELRAGVTEAARTDTTTMSSAETAGDFDPTTKDSNETDEVLKSPADNVTSADQASINKTKADKRARDRRSFIGIAILLSIFINAILATVILCLYKKELLVWYKRRTLETGSQTKGEAEPLNQILRGIRSAHTFL